MEFNHVNQEDVPTMKSKDERLSQFKRSLVRGLVYVVGMLLYDIFFVSSHVDNGLLLWGIRVLYSLGFVVSLHASRVLYQIYELENELRKQGVHTTDDLRQRHNTYNNPRPSDD